MPLTLRSSLEKFRFALTKLRNLHFFISETLDRRKDKSGIEDCEKPPFTYEAFAEALSNVLNLFSADLLEIERKIKSKQETFTILSFFSEISSWMQIINSLGKYIGGQNMIKNSKKKILTRLKTFQSISTPKELAEF